MTTVALSLKTKSSAKFSLTTKMVELFKAMAQEMAVRSAINELHALTDRQLNDLGIARGDIEKRVRGL